ncbi:MAG: chemotaxis protein CheB [Candidatus Xenobia bacterium]
MGRQGPRRAPSYVVGVGASAGGLEAFTQLLTALPPDTGMAFVLIQHLDPTQPTMLPQILSRVTTMPVVSVTEEVEVAADQVYVIPPDRDLLSAGKRLTLVPRPQHGLHRPIDLFFASLAQEIGRRAIGVVLSGTFSDGTAGLQAIRAAEGITFAQLDSSARFDSMPRHAAASGAADYVLPPEGIARELVAIAGQPNRWSTSPRLQALTPNVMVRILTQLRKVTGVDFSGYNEMTLKRRIARRIVLHRLESPDQFVRLLQEQAGEVDNLFEDVLINVTSFFRDVTPFETLREHLPRIESDDAPFRVWVPGCSTGEEAYSIAIVLLEYFAAHPLRRGIQVFATDVSQRSVDRARAGRYGPLPLQHVSEERLRRFFVKEADSYAVAESVRACCIFARQNVVDDPPFSHLDLISCRNLLIYLAPAAKEKVLQTFHYALRPGGLLLLGATETIGKFTDLFEPASKPNKLYVRRATPPRRGFHMSLLDYRPAALADQLAFGTGVVGSELDMTREVERVMLERYAPAAVVVNDNLEVVYFRGGTGPYLAPAAGPASFHLMKMVRQGLRLDLRTALRDSKETNGVVTRQGLPLQDNKQRRTVRLEVVPLRLGSTPERFFLVSFCDQPAPPSPVQSAADGGDSVDEVRAKLVANRKLLAQVLEEKEAANEAIRTTGEKFQAGMEELQSTNEELQTAQEELQVINEELTTVNDELQNRNVELNETNNDLNNLLASTNLPIVMVGRDLRVRRFTPSINQVLHLVGTDCGRRLGEIRTRLDLVDLEPILAEVIRNAAVLQRAVKDDEGRKYSLQVRPYVTGDGRVDGAILTFLPQLKGMS